jgi:hypothetical protein
MTSRAQAAVVASVAVAVLGCATAPAVTTERRPDGIYHLKCKTPLQVCLNEAESVCNHQRYAVLRAFDDHEYKGDVTFPTESRVSEAFVRCGIRAAWGDENNDLKKAPLCSEAATPAPEAARVGCAPGISVACVGPAGCAGGQVCLPDGAKFGPCDCGAASSPPAPSTPSP